MDRAQHWQHLYDTKEAGALSWFQADPSASLELLDRAGLSPKT